MTTSRLAALIGIALALALGAFATALRLDRDRAFYPMMLMVSASYYVRFGIMSCNASIVSECNLRWL